MWWFASVSMHDGISYDSAYKWAGYSSRGEVVISGSISISFYVDDDR